MKINKAPAEDDVVVEALKVRGEIVIHALMLYTLCPHNDIARSKWNNIVVFILYKTWISQI